MRAWTSSPSCGRWWSRSLSARNPTVLVSMTSPWRSAPERLDEATTFAAILSGVGQNDAMPGQLALDRDLHHQPVGSAEDGQLVGFLQGHGVASAALALVVDGPVDEVDQLRLLANPVRDLDPPDLQSDVQVEVVDAEIGRAVGAVAVENLRGALEDGRALAGLQRFDGLEEEAVGDFGDDVAGRRVAFTQDAAAAFVAVDLLAGRWVVADGDPHQIDDLAGARGGDVAGEWNLVVAEPGHGLQEAGQRPGGDRLGKRLQRPEDQRAVLERERRLGRVGQQVGGSAQLLGGAFGTDVGAVDGNAV